MNSNHKQDKQGSGPVQRQKMKKYAVFTLMFAIFAACLWLIFAPSADDAKAEQAAGFNSEIPMPAGEDIIGDKEDAYEQESMQQKQQEKMKTLQDFSELFGSGREGFKGEKEPEGLNDNNSRAEKASSMESSAYAYQNMNRTLGGFYRTSGQDYEKERLKQEVEELKRQRMDNSQNLSSSLTEQTALMEKSYRLAAKYFPQGQNGSDDRDSGDSRDKNNEETENFSVQPSTVRIVSALPQEKEGSPAEDGSSFRNFLTPTLPSRPDQKNTFSVCISEDQTIRSGQGVKLRLLEPLLAGGIPVPKNTLISGTAKIQGERLGISVGSIEYGGMILPVKMEVYDTDGQSGIFIPDMQDVSALKEIAANMGTSAGTSINFSDNAGGQLAADMGRSLIQGTSQLFSTKLRDVKVRLKAGYKIFLLPSKK